MAMLRRQKAFLTLITAFGALLLLVGTWETVMLGAPHQLLVGTLTLAATAVAFLLAKLKQRSDAVPGADGVDDSTDNDV